MPFRNLYYSMLGNIIYFYCNHTKTTVAFILQMDNPEQEENPCCFFSFPIFGLQSNFTLNML